MKQLTTRISQIPDFIKVLIAFTIINSILFLGLLTDPGTIGIRSDWPFPPLKEQIEQQVKTDVFYSWSSNYMGYERIRQSGNYVDLTTYAIIRIFGVGGEVISKYPIFLLFFVGPLTYFILRKLKITPFAAFFGGAFYSYCVPFLYDSLINGYAKFIFSYLFYPPLMYYLYDYLVSNKKTLAKFLFLALLIILVSTTINFFFISAITAFFCLIAISFKNKFNLGLFIKNVVIIIVLYILAMFVQATAFLPSLYDVIYNASNETLSKLNSALIAFLTFSHPDTTGAFKLHSAVDNYFEASYPTRKNPIGEVSFLFHLVYYFALFSLIFGSFASLRKRRKWDIIMILLIVAGVFILKGINEPLGFINQSFYKVPLMSVLRNISYIVIILAFPYSYFLAKGLEKILEVADRKYLFKNAIVLVAIVTILLGAYPLWGKGVLGTLKEYQLKSTQIKVFEKLSGSEENYNIIFYPNISPYVFSPEYDTYVGPGFNPLISNPAKPVFHPNISKVNGTHYLNSYLTNYLAYENRYVLSDLLQVGNIKNILHDTYFESVFPQFINLKDNKWYKSHVANRNIAKKLQKSDLLIDTEVSSENVSLYKVHRYNDTQVSLVERVFLNVGGYESYLSNSFLDTPIVLNGIFARDYKESIEGNISFIKFSDSSFISLVLALVGDSFVYRPADYVEKNRNEPQKEWTPIYEGQYWWYDNAIPEINDSMIILEEAGISAYKIPLRVEEGLKYTIYAKVLLNDRGGDLGFSIDSGTSFVVNTLSTESRGFNHLEIGSFIAANDPEVLNISTLTPSLNVISEIVVVTEEVYGTAELTAERLVADKPIVYSTSPVFATSVGSYNNINDFYYSRPSQISKHLPSKIDIFEDGEYDIFLMGSTLFTKIEENIIPDAYFVVKPDKPIIEMYEVPHAANQLEYCFSYSYFDTKKMKPSDRLPKSPMFIDISDSTGRVIYSSVIKPASVYTKGDWFFSCEELILNDKVVDIDIKVKFYTEAEDITWGLASAVDDESGELVIKSKLSGKFSVQNLKGTLLVDGKNTANFDILDHERPILVGKKYLSKGTHLFDYDCKDLCELKFIVLAPTGFSLSPSDNHIEYEKINPTKYETNLRENSSSKILVLKDSYSPYWKLSPSISMEGSHFIINGYQNAWLLDNFDKYSNQDVEIYFEKQKVYNYSNILSFTTLGVIVLGILASSIYNRRKKGDFS